LDFTLHLRLCMVKRCAAISSSVCNASDLALAI
jgi:hypothetical protein